MSYSQIRINKTEDLSRIMRALKQRYPLLNETEIVKMAISDLYVHQMEVSMDDDGEWETVVDFTEGGKIEGPD